MSLKSLFAPETVKTFTSAINGEIRLIRFVDDLRLEVGGLTQSGNVMVGIFSTGIKYLLPADFVAKNILLLGLGGGSVARWLSQKYPDAKITAVEIDPVMIDIARRYFAAGQIKNLKIVAADAVKYIKAAKQQYDLTLVDCFQGYQTPPEFDDHGVLVRMKSHTDHLLINRLYWDDFKLKTDDFVARIGRRFQVKSVYTASNLVISLN